MRDGQVRWLEGRSTPRALPDGGVLWHGYPIAVHLTDHAPAAGVDTPEDLARVRRHYDDNCAAS